jgi:hypothetical protein
MKNVGTSVKKVAQQSVLIHDPNNTEDIVPSPQITW